MKAFVTGSAGFIGSHLVEALMKRGDTVYCVDKKDGRDLTKVDVRFLGDLFSDVDVVFHLAATCSTLGSIRDPMETFTDTVVTAAAVTEGCRLAEVPLILTSSVKARDGRTPYGAAKRMAETWAIEAAETFGLPVVINRPGTVYGPGQEGSEESGWIAWFLRARDEGLPVVINGSGTQERDLLYVADYVRLLLLQADDLVAHGRESHYTDDIWDVGGGSDNTVTVRGMAEHLGLVYLFGPPRLGDASSYIGRNNLSQWAPATHWRDSGLF